MNVTVVPKEKYSELYEKPDKIIHFREAKFIKDENKRWKTVGFSCMLQR